jgi:hypothetical protein
MWSKIGKPCWGHLVNKNVRKYVGDFYNGNKQNRKKKNPLKQKISKPGGETAVPLSPARGPVR